MHVHMCKHAYPHGADTANLQYLCANRSLRTNTEGFVTRCALTKANEPDSVPLRRSEGRSAVVVGTPGAENPKYRHDALRRSESCRKGEGAGGGRIVVSSREVHEGLRVDLSADLNEGHVKSLLLDTSSGADRVI